MKNFFVELMIYVMRRIENFVNRETVDKINDIIIKNIDFQNVEDYYFDDSWQQESYYVKLNKITIEVMSNEAITVYTFIKNGEALYNIIY